MSLQLAAEERVGWLGRERAYRARAEEDAAWAAMAEAVPPPERPEPVNAVGGPQTTPPRGVSR